MLLREIVATSKGKVTSLQGGFSLPEIMENGIIDGNVAIYCQYFGYQDIGSFRYDINKQKSNKRKIRKYWPISTIYRQNIGYLPIYQIQNSAWNKHACRCRFFAKLPIYLQISLIYWQKNWSDLTVRIIGHVEG